MLAEPFLERLDGLGFMVGQVPQVGQILLVYSFHGLSVELGYVDVKLLRLPIFELIEGLQASFVLQFQLTPRFEDPHEILEVESEAAQQIGYDSLIEFLDELLSLPFFVCQLSIRVLQVSHGHTQVSFDLYLSYNGSCLGLNILKF